MFNIEKNKTKTSHKGTLTLSLCPQDAAVVLAAPQPTSGSSTLQPSFSVVNLNADNIGCLINNCASKMDTGEGTCFPLFTHPAAPVNGFRNYSKYPDCNLVQLLPLPPPPPFLEGHASFLELSSAICGCALENVDTEADSWCGYKTDAKRCQNPGVSVSKTHNSASADLNPTSNQLLGQHRLETAAGV